MVLWLEQVGSTLSVVCLQDVSLCPCPPRMFRKNHTLRDWFHHLGSRVMYNMVRVADGLAVQNVQV